MALFTEVQHLCTFNIIAPLIYHLLPNIWKATYTIKASIFVQVSYWPLYSMHKFISCVVPGPLKWFFHFGDEIIIAWTHIGWVRWLFQNLPLPAAHAVRDSSSGVTTCIVMMNDGIMCHQVSTFCLELWTKVLLQERAVVGSVYRLPWGYSVMQCYPINCMWHNEHLHSTLCRAHFL